MEMAGGRKGLSKRAKGKTLGNSCSLQKEAEGNSRRPGKEWGGCLPSFKEGKLSV